MAPVVQEASDTCSLYCVVKLVFEAREKNDLSLTKPTCRVSIYKWSEKLVPADTCIDAQMC